MVVYIRWILIVFKTGYLRTVPINSYSFNTIFVNCKTVTHQSAGGFALSSNYGGAELVARNAWVPLWLLVILFLPGSLNRADPMCAHLKTSDMSNWNEPEFACFENRLRSFTRDDNMCRAYMDKTHALLLCIIHYVCFLSSYPNLFFCLPYVRWR